MGWFTCRKDEIAGIAAIGGILIGLVGFGLTICQLQRANQTLQASNTYQVQKDARAILDEIKKNKKFLSAINNGISTENQESFLDSLWIMLNFYLSVYRQSEIEGLSPSFVDSFRRDFCQFINLKSVGEGWDKLKTDNRLANAHDEMRRKWCGT